MAIDQQAVRARLERERTDLLSRLEEPIEVVRGDEADMATMSQNKERTLWLAHDAEQRLEAIDKALERIANGTYGLCASCGKPIPEERLAAIPLALYDVECQGKLEKKNRR